jgi:hypothetical protein
LRERSVPIRLTCFGIMWPESLLRLGARERLKIRKARTQIISRGNTHRQE